MKSTGIVRRIDDLGRLVIPKEIRRTLKIKEGDPFELFIMDDKSVCFQKYSPYSAADWETAKRILLPIIDFFGILDRNGDVQVSTAAEYRNNYEKVVLDPEMDVIEIRSYDFDHDLYAYLVVRKTVDKERVNLAKEVLYNFLSVSGF
jgi:stage V sporulation protein T